MLLTSLIAAALNRHVDVIKLLLEQEGIDVNAKTNFGTSAIKIAQLTSNSEIIEILKAQKGIKFKKNLVFSSDLLDETFYLGKNLEYDKKSGLGSRF